MSLRNERIKKTLMKEISDILMRSLRDPRILGVVSITDIELSHDNSYAKVYYSVYPTQTSIKTPEEQKQKTIAAMEELTPRIRYEVGKRIRLRLTPELRFICDDSLERGARVTELIDKISRGEL